MSSIPIYSSNITFPQVDGQYINFNLSHIVNTITKVICLFDQQPSFQFTDTNYTNIMPAAFSSRDTTVASAGFLHSIPNLIEYNVPLAAINLTKPSLVYGTNPIYDTFSVLQIDTTKVLIEPGFNRLQVSYTWTQSNTAIPPPPLPPPPPPPVPHTTVLYGANGYYAGLSALNQLLVQLSSAGNLVTMTSNANSNWTFSYIQTSLSTYNVNQLIWECFDSTYGGILADLLITNLTFPDIYSSVAINFNPQTGNYRITMQRAN